MADFKPGKKNNNFNKKTSQQPSPEGCSPKRPARINSSTGDLRIRKLPRQERSKMMVEAILEAAAEVVAQLGYARATTNKIAARAGVSVGSLYQYFPNKDSLLARLMEEHNAEIHGVVNAALERLADPSMDLEDGLRKFIADLLEVHRANPDLTKALSEDVRRESQMISNATRGNDNTSQTQQLFDQLFRRPDVRCGDPAVMSAIFGQVTGHLSRWLLHDAPPGLDPSLLMEEMVQLLFRYLKK